MDKSFMYLLVVLLCSINVFAGGVYVSGGIAIVNASNVTSINVTAQQICLTSGVCLAPTTGFVYSDYFNQALNKTSNITFYNLTITKNISAEYVISNFLQGYLDYSYIVNPPWSTLTFVYANYFNQGLNKTSNVTFNNVNSSSINSSVLTIRGQSTLGYENFTTYNFATESLYADNVVLLNALGIGSSVLGNAVKYWTYVPGVFNQNGTGYINATGVGSIAMGNSYAAAFGASYSIVSSGQGSLAGGYSSAGNILGSGAGSLTWGTGILNNTHPGGFCVGQGNTLNNGPSAVSGVAIGASNTVNESYGVAIGFGNTVATGSTFGAVAIGGTNAVKGRSSAAFGYSNTQLSGVDYQYTLGASLTSLRASSVMVGWSTNYLYTDTVGVNISGKTSFKNNATMKNLTFTDNSYNILANLFYNGTSFNFDVNQSGGKDLIIKTGNTSTLVLDNPVWNDLQIFPTGVRLPTSGPPVYAYLNGTEILQFSASAKNTIYFSVQLPHDYKEGSNIEFHIHDLYNSNGAGNSNFTLGINWVNVGANIGTGLNYTAVIASPTTANRHAIEEIAPVIPGTGMTVSSIILGNFSRNGNAGDDTYTGTTNLIGIDFHYQVDTLGSRTQTAK